MSQPQWITPAGSLSTIQEGVFYQVPLQATAAGQDVYYRLIAGQLPEGIQVKLNGTIEGVPKPVAITQGVPAEVSENVTSKFAVRAFTERVVNGVRVVDRIADRTFEITVTGNDPPKFITPPGRIGTFYDGTEIDLQIEINDPDPDDDVVVLLAAGELPPGVILTRQGLITGFIEPLVGPPGTAEAGWSRTPNDEYPWDFVTRSASRNYQFTLEAYDGKEYGDTRTFSIYVYSRDSMTADTTDFDASNTFITADASPTRTPVLITPEGDLGRIRADNWFAYKFDAIDFDGDQVEFAITVGEGVGFDAEGTTFDEDDIGFDRGNFFLPPGLTIDINSGWFYGYIPDQGATEQTYRFAVRVKKASNPDIISPYYYFTITIIGNIETEVIWITPQDLGFIDNGAVSTLSIEAYNTGGRALEYRLAPGSDSRLPQGLTLLPSGNIVGRVSFNTFALDGGTTTFDQERSTRLAVDPTTFDMTCEFTVNAYAPISQDLGYQVSAFTVTNGGSGYHPVTVTVSSPPPGPEAVGATAYAKVVNGVITDIIIDEPGFGYVTAPTITIDAPPPGGVTATAVATISGSRVTSITVTSGGAGYRMPTVTVSVPSQAFGSIQATAGAITVVNGRITEIAVGNPGRGYITAPTVVITSTAGSGATAVSSIAAVATVNAVSVLRRFTVMLRRQFNVPYERLYIKAMPPLADRNLVNQLLLNQDIIPADRVYRRDDPNFGVAQDVVYDHAYGLAPATLDDYARSLDINHYWKNLLLGEIRTAQALAADGSVMYEVVYSVVLGGLTNRAGESVSKTIRWPYPIELDDSSQITTVYPASLPNMRDQVIDSVGQISPALPLWMTSKQADGRVLGFVPAWVICYTQPGESARIAYNIRELFGDQLNKVDFKADRYELDRSQTYNWDPATDSWIAFPESTEWDIVNAYATSQVVYTINENELPSSETPLYYYRAQRTVPAGTLISNTYYWKKINQATTFDQTTTIFDGGSVKFIVPADQYTSTDRRDKYLLYPRINILG
jgi:hypothetical protein